MSAKLIVSLPLNQLSQFRKEHGNWIRSDSCQWCFPVNSLRKFHVHIKTQGRQEVNCYLIPRKISILKTTINTVGSVQPMDSSSPAIYRVALLKVVMCPSTGHFLEYQTRQNSQICLYYLLFFKLKYKHITSSLPFHPSSPFSILPPHFLSYKWPFSFCIVIYMHRYMQINLVSQFSVAWAYMISELITLYWIIN